MLGHDLQSHFHPPHIGPAEPAHVAVPAIRAAVHEPGFQVGVEGATHRLIVRALTLNSVAFASYRSSLGTVAAYCGRGSPGSGSSSLPDRKPVSTWAARSLTSSSSSSLSWARSASGQAAAHPSPGRDTGLLLRGAQRRARRAAAVADDGLAQVVAVHPTGPDDLDIHCHGDHGTRP
ncbi:hypothetical protein [Streptomyces sp. NPDC059092]|uniref:hypothetical protein n=1 Tax=Streptomyces sp. NPDC059092 TaxID=3346725 RepID=UPI0036BD93E3